MNCENDSHQTQANRMSLDLEKGLPRVGELRRQVKFVVQPRREPAGQRHRRRADRQRPFAPVPPVFLNRAIASSRPFVSGFKVKVNMNFMSFSFQSLRSATTTNSTATTVSMAIAPSMIESGA